MKINTAAKAPGKKGYARLVFFFRVDGKLYFIPSKIKVLAGAWKNEDKRITKLQPNYDKLNSKLLQRKALLQSIFDDYDHFKIAYDVPEIRRKFYEKLKGTVVEAPTVSFYDYMDQYVAKRKAIRANSYLRIFKQVKNWLQLFRPNLTFQDITLQFYNEWVTYLLEEGDLNDNTISSHISKLKSVMGEAIMDPALRGIKIPMDYKLFEDTYKDPKPFWLSWETDLKALESFDAGEDQIYLEEFLFRCYTGLRHSDVNHLGPANFVKKDNSVWVDYTMIKTKLDKNIELNSQAIKILKRWKFTPPKLVMQDCNEIIKEIGRAAGLKGVVEKVRYAGKERKVQLLPKHKLITTHTARRTFARRWMEKDGNIGMLSKYLGHSSIDITSKYIGWETEEVNQEMKRLFG